MTRAAIVGCILILIAFASAAARAQEDRDGVYARFDNGLLRFGNGSIERAFSLKDDAVRTVVIENRLSGRRHDVFSNEFELHLSSGETLTTEDFAFVDWRLIPSVFGEVKMTALELELAGRDGRFRVVLRYALSPESWFMRKEVRVLANRPVDVTLDKLVVESLKVLGVTFRESPEVYSAASFYPSANLPAGFGQPVLSDEIFVGLEYPAGYNRVDGERTVRVWHHPNAAISEDGIQSKSAVLGVSKPGEILPRFHAYIETVKAYPVHPRPYVAWNSAYWDSLRRRLNENLNLDLNLATAMIAFRDNLVHAFGVRLDAFNFEGWDNVFGEQGSTLLPGWTRGVINIVRQMGSDVGIWLSPSGHYHRGKSGIQLGYAQLDDSVSGGGIFRDKVDLADPKYKEHLIQVMIEYVQQGIRHFKLDGITVGSPGNEPQYRTGAFAVEDRTDAYIEVLSAVRKSQPDVFIESTVGTWPSPWWLMYVDAVWMGGPDYPVGTAPPSHDPRDSVITTQDAILRTQIHNFPAFPVWGYRAAGINDVGLTGSDVPTKLNWHKNAVMVLARGPIYHVVFLRPHVLDEKDWSFLARSLQWARSVAGVAAEESRLILGKPERGEVYGYAHAGEETGFSVLRNPDPRPRRIAIKAVELGAPPGRMDPAEEWALFMVYPYRAPLGHFRPQDTVSLDLAGHEVLLLQFVKASELTRALPLNAPLELLEQSERRIRWRVWHEETSNADRWEDDASGEVSVVPLDPEEGSAARAVDLRVRLHAPVAAASARLRLMFHGPSSADISISPENLVIERTDGPGWSMWDIALPSVAESTWTLRLSGPRAYEALYRANSADLRLEAWGTVAVPRRAEVLETPWNGGESIPADLHYDESFRMRAYTFPLVVKGLGKAGAVEERVVEESDPALSFTGRWGSLANPEYSGGAYRYSSIPGSAVELEFSGTSIALAHARAPFMGIARVWIDDERVLDVDMYGEAVRRGVWTTISKSLSPGLHRLRLEVLAERNEASSGNHVIVDAFRISSREHDERERDN